MELATVSEKALKTSEENCDNAAYIFYKDLSSGSKSGEGWIQSMKRNGCAHKACEWVGKQVAKNEYVCNFCKLLVKESKANCSKFHTAYDCIYTIKMFALPKLFPSYFSYTMLYPAGWIKHSTLRDLYTSVLLLYCSK